MMAGDENPALRQEALKAGQEISKQAQQLLFKLGEAEVTQGAQTEIVDAAKAVAQATIQLVTQGAKPMASESTADPQFAYISPQIIQIAKQAGAAAETLVTCAFISAPAI